MTLIELSVVLLVLVALAGLTLMSLQSTPRYAECIATDTTLANIREAIMGGAGQAGYLSDMGGVPSLDGTITISGNSYSASSLTDLFNSPVYNIKANQPNPPTPTKQNFNPVTQHGWRGPYLSGGVACTTVLSKAPSAVNVCSSSGSSLKEITAVALDSFAVIDTNSSGSTSTELSGSPIVLMQDTTTNGTANGKYFLVSGGPNNTIDTTPITVETRSNDDRVLFLNAPDPSPTGNQPCSN